MTAMHSAREARPLRLWPGVAIVVVQWLLYYVGSTFAPDIDVFSLPLGLILMIGGPLGGIAILIWWLFFSRAAWLERIGAIVLMVAAVTITRMFVDESIAGAGQGNLLYVSTIPPLSLALVAWAAITRHMTTSTRRAALVVAIVLACVPWTLVRTAGVMGGSGGQYHWRWTPTPEELLLAQEPTLLTAPAAQPAAVSEPSASAAAPTVPTSPPVEANASTPVSRSVTPSPSERSRGIDEGHVTTDATSTRAEERIEWPGFRGRARDGVIRGVEINTDWSSAPPVEMWRHAVGPGWSSFAVQGDLIYTQEQRGEDEIVSCYRLSTGEPVWRHREGVRFWESNGGAGPRSTPSLHNGRVYAFGATGLLNALDATSGKQLWIRNVAEDANRVVPDWGFSSSPLIVNDLVVVAAAGTLVAYDLASGDLRWKGPRYGGSYSSPHLLSLDGVDQIVLLGGPGVISVTPDTGAVLWEHKWTPGSIVQPAVTADGDILVNAIAATGGTGTRRLHVTRSATGWNLEERWTSMGLKPFFNDLVVHKGHAYGFDGSILASISLDDGTRKWKGGRFGNGQMVLLPNQDLLLVVSEEGEVVLVRAAPDKFTEVARFAALNAKTWNHPVIVGDVLLLRNGEEMAAFRLPKATN
jgi:outer membrane protein assembly factor BamB